MGYEQPAVYIGRIWSLSSELGIGVDVVLDISSSRTLKSWYYRLPSAIQQSMAPYIEEVYKQGTIRAYIALVEKHVPQKPEKVDPAAAPLHCPYCPKKVSYTCDCETYRMANKRHSQSSYLGSSQRRYDTPPNSQRRYDHQTSTQRRYEPGNDRKPTTRGACWGCGENGHSERDCPKNRKTTAAMIESETLEIPNVIGVYERIAFEEEDDTGFSSAISTANTMPQNRDLLRPKVDLI